MKRFSLNTWLEGLQLFLMMGTGHFITLLGSAMSRFAFGVWVYQSTGRVQDFAIVLVTGFLPGILISPLAGVWIDRKGPRTMVLAGDLLGGAAMATVLPAVWAGHFTVPHLLIVTAVLSCASALQAPAMMALIPGIVPATQVERANGIFATLTATTDMLGPALAGLLLAMNALSLVVLSDLISYGAAIVVTLSLWARLAPPKGAAAGDGEAAAPTSWWRDLVEGERYIIVNRPLFHLILLFTALNFGIGFLGVLMPPFALTMGTARELGFANGAYGLGTVVGGLLMTAWKYNTRRIPQILWASLILGLAIAGGGLARIAVMLGVALCIVGVVIPIVNTLTVTVLQLKSDPSYLGRVFAMARMLAWISLPVAQILAGRLADTLQAVNTQATLVLPTWLLGAGSHAAYGVVLLGTGLFIILASAGFSRVKSLYLMDEEGTLQREAA